MKKILCIALLFFMFLGEVFPWGQNGHRVIGLVAEQHLNRKAKRKIMNILKNNSLAEVSVWMDDIKSDSAYNHTHDWHWVTIPDGLTYEEAEKNPSGDLLMKIEELIAVLEKGELPAEQEEEYLKFLIHLVGDLHQPLHVGGGDDAGGNAVRVDWFRNPSNLHRVWDSDMIDSRDLSYTELTHFLGKPSKSQVREWQAASVKDWAYENMAYRPQIYKIPENGKLGYEYRYKNMNLVEKRLLQAGIRLAGLLNHIYG